MAKAKVSPWQLFKQALRDYRMHWSLLVGIILVVSLPIVVLSALKIVDTSSDTTASAYLGFAQLAMNTAIIYAIVQVMRGEKPPTIRQAYYKGSGAFLRLFLVSFLLVLMLMFLLLGVFIV
ncbi:MAG TPA: hypothetical protein VMR98_05915, partial [Candidatus Polarisedimenticolaceae bacterium]|nr:hypothetical protein [Candidatus Polarisedimenticolaceae bacterium]